MKKNNATTNKLSCCVYLYLVMPPRVLQPTTAEQTRFVVSWLSKEENRLACFGGAGAKAAYGGKAVVKPATAYNSLAQAVNAKFGTSWDGESAKARVRTMKNKFQTVFSLSNGGRVQEESAAWKLSDADKSKGILTLADKAQDMCPHWNSWMEWCGSDPNMLKHGSGGIDIDANIREGSGEDEVEVEGHLTDEGDVSDADGVADGVAVGPETFAGFSAGRLSAGDKGNLGDNEDDVPRAVSCRVDSVTGGTDDLREQQRKRKEMLGGMDADAKKRFYAQEQREKRQKEQADSEKRRSSIAAAAAPAVISSSPTSSGSPFAKGSSSQSKDWQANFLVEHKKDEQARAERHDAAQVTIAKLQLEAAQRQNDVENEHKQQVLSFQQMQFSAQQQQAQMQMQFQQQQAQSQMQFQQQQQMMYVFCCFRLACVCVTALQVYANETA
jgi:hypothetical protein